MIAGAWPEDRVAQLRALWAEGLSTAEIGRRLGVSKNAAVGKAGRIGLPGRPSPIVRTGEAEKPSRKPVNLPDLSASKPVAAEVVTTPALPALPALPVAAAVPATPTPASRPASQRSCQRPLWGNERATHQYCDAPAAPGRPYCAACCQIMYVRRGEVAA